MTNPELIIERLRETIQRHFASRIYFACVYGSYASGCQTSFSDIDFFVAVEDPQDSDLETLIALLSSLEHEYALALDTEVPYKNKLLLSFTDLEHAVALDAFVLDGTTIVIPSIRKESAFLESSEIRWRLALNALTTPHIHLVGNLDMYRKYRLSAEHAVRVLSKFLADKSSSLEIRLQALITSNDGATGESFLGYKPERQPVIRYLRNILAQGENTESLYPF